MPVSDAYKAPFAFCKDKLDRIVMRFEEDPDPANVAHGLEMAD